MRKGISRLRDWTFPTLVLAVVAAGPSAAFAQDGPRLPSGRSAGNPYTVVNQAGLLTDLEALTEIRSYAGWRTSGSSGEREAVEWLAAEMQTLSHLVSWGLELEQQSFNLFTATEFRDTRVQVQIAGELIEIPAFAVQGRRDNLDISRRFDSDGRLNDTNPDPVEVQAEPYVVLWDDDLSSLPDLSGRVVLMDYALVDDLVVGPEVAEAHAEEILDRNPAAVVPITSFSNVNGESHGTFAGDVPVWVIFDRPMPPILNIRLEDLDQAGITSWSQLTLIDSVWVIWDVDIAAPGTSLNLMARIPGRDASRAVILGAHVDSPNSPGASDDGSGTVSLLQVARALDRLRTRPPVDVVLVWFGSEERGLYGSTVFAANHQELLDRTMAMLAVDCLGVPLDGGDPFLNLRTWTYGVFGDDRPTFPDYLAQAAADQEVFVASYGAYEGGSDQLNFSAWDVPNAKLGYYDPEDPTQYHYANHVHDPYDTVELVRLESEALVDMATVTLSAALAIGEDDPVLRVTPPPDRRVLFVGTHTEGAHMTPSQLIFFGQTLAWHGFDVDMVPYGTSVTADDLEDAHMVVVLPVHDYPSAGGSPNLYDEAWTAEEADFLEAYARSGGLLVLTNSAHRMKYFNSVYELNEDAVDMNEVSGRFGITYNDGLLHTDSAVVIRNHPLVAGLTVLEIAPGNGVPFVTTAGETLAYALGSPALHLQAVGAGEVVVLADLGMLNHRGTDLQNLTFWNNLASYARSR